MKFEIVSESVTPQDFLRERIDKCRIDDAVLQRAEHFLNKATVEKRNHLKLSTDLIGVLDGTKDTTPIVLKDWVLWVNYFEHQDVLRALSILATNDITTDEEYALRANVCWYISGSERKTIVVGDSYEPSVYDSEIFKYFTIKEVSANDTLTERTR